MIDADMFFQRMSKATPAGAESKPAPDIYGEMSARLYEQPEQPESLTVPNSRIQAVRDTPERRLYPQNAEYARVVTADDFQHLDLDEAKAAAMETRAICADMGISPCDVGAMLNRSRALAADPVTSRRQQREAHRLPDIQGDVAAARALLQRDHRAAELIDLLGLGDDAETIRVLASAARSQAAKGHLNLSRK